MYSFMAGMLPPACQRAILVLSAGMLMFACKIYQIHDLNDVFSSLAISEVSDWIDSYTLLVSNDVTVRGLANWFW